jgi:hypothetical protein
MPWSCERLLGLFRMSCGVCCCMACCRGAADVLHSINRQSSLSAHLRVLEIDPVTINSSFSTDNGLQHDVLSSHKLRQLAVFASSWLAIAPWGLLQCLTLAVPQHTPSWLQERGSPHPLPADTWMQSVMLCSHWHMLVFYWLAVVLLAGGHVARVKSKACTS